MNLELEPSPQPLLFDEDQLPVLPAVVAAAVKWEHNGRYTLGDEELCHEIAQRVVMGFSARSIARTLHVSRLTVRAVMHVLEERGKLGPLKQRMSRKMGYAIDLCLDRSIEALENNTVQVNVLPILAGVLFDKRALLEGDPTARIEHSQAETVTVESFKAWLKELKDRARPPAAIEVESSGLTEIAECSSGSGTDGTVNDACAGGLERVECTVPGPSGGDGRGGGSSGSPAEK